MEGGMNTEVVDEPKDDHASGQRGAVGSEQRSTTSTTDKGKGGETGKVGSKFKEDAIVALERIAEFFAHVVVSTVIATLVLLGMVLFGWVGHWAANQLNDDVIKILIIWFERIVAALDILLFLWYLFYSSWKSFKNWR
jgi:hypothetical protein